ncbi:hypothetical protein, partial [Deinococcus sp. 23YEL01]|uniref:hypothetical protein n=1 Tax=Deinococcus sp. 23YEL01 TaxID=2745871 RepID=UPI001E30B005
RIDLGTGMLEHPGHQWNGPPTEQDGYPDEAEFLEQDAGIQSEDQGVLASLAECASDDQTVEQARVKVLIAQPALKAAFAALRERCAGVNVMEPERGCAAP